MDIDNLNDEQIVIEEISKKDFLSLDSSYEVIMNSLSKKIIDVPFSELIRTKEDIVSVMDKIIGFYTNATRTKDMPHTNEYYRQVLEYCERLQMKLDRAKIFDAPVFDSSKYDFSGVWFYAFEFDSSSLKLKLKLGKNTSKVNDIVTVDSFVEDFTFMEVPIKYLSIDEFVESMSEKGQKIEKATVRQWIRRGKLRDVVKNGGEWVVSTLAEVTKNGYVDSAYTWNGNLDLPIDVGIEGFSGRFFNIVDGKSILSIKTSEEANMFKLVYQGLDLDGGVTDLNKPLSKDEKDKLEAFLIANKRVKKMAIDAEGNLVEDVILYVDKKL